MGEWVELARWIALGLVGTVSVIFLPLWLIGLVHTFLEHRRAMKQMGMEDETLTQQLQALRREIDALRHTTTEHLLSLQDNLENLQERVRALETARENQTPLRLP